MKNRVLKVLFLLLVVLSFLAGLYLVFDPLKREVQIGHYDVKKDLNLRTFGGIVEETINIKNDSTFRIMFFLENRDYDNLEVVLYDALNSVVFDTKVSTYKSDAMFFEFPPLEPGEYRLVVKDNDGDDLNLYVGKSTGDSYLKGDNEFTLQLVTYHRENYYFYLWYPLFLLSFLATVYPFVWGDKNEK